MKKTLFEIFLASAILSVTILGCASLGTSGQQPPMPAPSAMDRFLFQIRTQQLAQVVPTTNVMFVTNIVPVYNEREVIRWATNDIGVVNIFTNILVQASFSTNYQVLTNYVDRTNYVESYEYTPKPVIVAGAETTGSIVNTFVPGVGGLISTALVGALGIYARWRSRKASAALVQSVQTGRELINQIKNDPTVDQLFKDFLIKNQKNEGVFGQVSDLVEKHANKPQAREDAQAILAKAELPPTQIRPLA